MTHQTLRKLADEGYETRPRHPKDMGIEERQTVPMSQTRLRESIFILRKASHKVILVLGNPTLMKSSGPKSGAEQRVTIRVIVMELGLDRAAPNTPVTTTASSETETSRVIVIEWGLDRAAPTTPVKTTASSETEMGTDLDQMPRAVQT
jgi:hypothetical protein